MDGEEQGKERRGVTTADDIPRVVDELCAIYDESVANLRSALARFLKNGERPNPADRQEACSPILSFASTIATIPGNDPRARLRPAQSPGRYATSIARPYLFRKYLTEQLTYLIDDYDVDVSVGRSPSEIPYPYVLDGTDDLRLDRAQAAELALWFPTTELANIGDEIADGEWLQPPGAAPAVAVRRAAGRFQPGAAAPLYRHAVRAHPALPAVHQLYPLCRRVRPLGGRRAEASPTAPIAACRPPAACS